MHRRSHIYKLQPLLNENKELTQKVADLKAELEKCLRKGNSSIAKV